MRGNSALAILLCIVGIACVVLAVIYFTLKTNLFASGHPIRHTDRAIVLIVVRSGVPRGGVLRQTTTASPDRTTRRRAAHDCGAALVLSFERRQVP